MNTPTEMQPGYVMVCVEKPTIEGAQPGVLKWPSLENNLAQRPQLTETSRRLCGNVWLFTEKAALLHLRPFLEQCQALGLSCQAYKLRGAPELVASVP